MKLRKFTSLVALALGGLGFFSANAFEYEGVSYKITSLDTRTVEVIQGAEAYADTLEIPSKVMRGETEYTVTGIGKMAFDLCTTMKMITLPATLEYIDSASFFNTKSLRTMNVKATTPPDVSSSPFATVMLSNLTVWVPDGSWQKYLNDWIRVYYINETGAFNATVNGINYQIFSPASKYARVKSSSPKYTGDVVLPATIEVNGETYKVVELAPYCFDGCADMTSLTLPEGIISVNAYSIRKANKLESVKFPSTVEVYNTGMLNACTGLKSVEMNSVAKRLENVLFQNCTALQSVVLPPNCEYVGPSTFSGCTALETVTNAEKITVIMSGCFTNTPKLQMHLPKGLVMLENSAFSNSGVIVDEFPQNLDYIEANIFKQCPNVKEIKITKNLKKIGASPFQNCVNLETVELPDSVGGTPGINMFAGCSKLKNVKLPKNLTFLPAYMFQKDSVLEAVEIPESVTALHNGVFSTCVSLKNFELPKNVNSLAAQCFANCTSLTEMTLPEPVYQIGSGLFANCSNLEKVKLSNNIALLNSFTFQNCTKLTEVQGIDSITTIANGAFLGCTSLTGFSVPKNVKAIWNNAFKGCANMKSVTFNACLDSIAKTSFQNCTGLTEVRFPASVKYIMDQSFSGCTGLTSVYSSSLTPPTLVNNAFDSTTYATANLYVKDEVKSVYAAAAGWMNFSHLLSGVTTVNDNDTPAVYGIQSAIVAPEEAIIYTIQGRRTGRENLPAGIYIVVCDDKTYKVVVK